MKAENLNLLAQLIESMNLAVKEFEKAFEKKDLEKFKKAKEEILKFQKQISEILERQNSSSFGERTKTIL